MIALRKKAETTDIITLEWDPVPGAIGYRFQSAAQPKWSHTFDPNRRDVKFSKAASYRIEALGVEDVGQYPSAPQPPVGGPIAITQGGTYTGYWRSGGATPPVTIATTQPVVIQDAIVEQTSDNLMLRTAVNGTNVTIRRTTFRAPVGAGNTRMNPTGVASWVVENCTLERTAGFYFQGIDAPASSRVRISRCKATNIQGANAHLFPNWSPRSFVQFNGFVGESAIVEWCEVINRFGESLVEDVVSGFNSHNVTVRHNFFWGGYPPVNEDGYSGSGFVFGEGGGSNCTGHDNQLVALMNVACGIVGGVNNSLLRNKCVSSGRIPDGTICKSANNGLVIYGIPDPASANNIVRDNVTGAYWWNAGSFGWNPWWSESGHGASNDFYNDNRELPQPVTPAQEAAEYPRWQQKLATNGISIGA